MLLSSRQGAQLAGRARGARGALWVVLAVEIWCIPIMPRPHTQTRPARVFVHFRSKSWDRQDSRSSETLNIHSTSRREIKFPSPASSAKGALRGAEEDGKDAVRDRVVGGMHHGIYACLPTYRLDDCSLRAELSVTL